MELYTREEGEMAQNEWRRVEGDLRAALAARDWSNAGASVWQLRQLDEGRYFEELDHYVTQQCRAGGYTMALETEQRLEAIRQHAMETMKSRSYEDERLLVHLSRGGVLSVQQVSRLPQWADELLVWEYLDLGERRVGRADMQDVIWSVIHDFSKEV